MTPLTTTSITIPWIDSWLDIDRLLQKHLQAMEQIQWRVVALLAIKAVEAWAKLQAKVSTYTQDDITPEGILNITGTWPQKTDFDFERRVDLTVFTALQIEKEFREFSTWKKWITDFPFLSNYLEIALQNGTQSHEITKDADVLSAVRRVYKIQLEQLTWGIVINGTQYEKPEKAYGHINTLLISVGLEPLSTHHKI